ncbi:hypothetical protein YC2023_045252 [Brassica napus]
MSYSQTGKLESTDLKLSYSHTGKLESTDLKLSYSQTGKLESTDLKLPTNSIGTTKKLKLESTDLKMLSTLQPVSSLSSCEEILSRLLLPYPYSSLVVAYSPM